MMPAADVINLVFLCVLLKRSLNRLSNSALDAKSLQNINKCSTTITRQSTYSDVFV